jgi:hypothetical protein
MADSFQWSLIDRYCNTAHAHSGTPHALHPPPLDHDLTAIAGHGVPMWTGFPSFVTSSAAGRTWLCCCSCCCYCWDSLCELETARPVCVCVGGGGLPLEGGGKGTGHSFVVDACGRCACVAVPVVRWPIHRTFVAAVVSRILQGLQQFPEEVRSQVWPAPMCMCAFVASMLPTSPTPFFLMIGVFMAAYLAVL